MLESASLKRSNLEVLPRLGNASWQRLDRKLESEIPFIWHHHPEMELTLTLNCHGKRFVGDNVSSFEPGDLALIGSNLPHTWASQERIDPSKPFHAYVLWFDKEWLRTIGQSAVELSVLVALSERAQRGLSFSGAVRERAQPMIQRLFELPPQQGFSTFLELLCLVAQDQETETLASQAVVDSVGGGYARIDRVLHHLHENYETTIRLEELAEVAALSPSGLHRMFKKHLGTTISAYIINLRIGEACARIAASNVPIGVIAQDVGYESQANFNRHFRRLRAMTPRAYRQANQS